MARITWFLIAAALFAAVRPAAAQDKPAPIVELVVGSSGFVDESWDYFTTIGGGARIFVTPRLAIGPEIAYLRGDREASNLTITGNLTFDFVRDDGTRRVIPYLAAGGGYLRQTATVGSGPGSTERIRFTSGEGTVSAGVGARVALGSRVFIAPEFRFGYEPETRVAVTVGMRPR